MRKSVLFGAVCAAGSLLAVPVTLDQARTAVGNWVGADAALGCRLGTSVAAARTCTTTNGASFHVVRLAEGGFVVTSADTACEPVVAFSSGRDLIESDANPLWSLLKGDADARARAAAARAGALRTSTRLGVVATGASAAQTAAEAKWARLLASVPSAALKGVASVSDVRVAPLLTTAWGQEEDDKNQLCFNYYTPNNYPCGCTATAGAQVMRYFAWPKTSVAPFTCTACAVDGVATTLTTQGGLFNWANMPDAPGRNATATESERQEIGRLTSDIGVICGMSYKATGSGAGAYMLLKAFQQFGYSNAMAYQTKTGVDGAVFRRALVSNLDAGLPIVVSVSGSAGGHAIVADGYGYSDTTFYGHFNMGWNGVDQVWYAPPTFEAANYGASFDTINGFVYNVFTNQTAGAVVVSGRVRDAGGTPVVGAAVRVTKDLDAWRVQTNAQGIYAVIVPSGDYVVTASFGSSTAVTNASPAAGVSTELADAYGSYWTSPAPSVGNLCDVDLVLSSVPSVAAPVFTPVSCSFYPATNVTIACATAGAVMHYTTDGSDPTEASAIYTGPIAVSDDVVIRVRAYAEGFNPSAVVSASYVYDASQGHAKGDDFANPLEISGATGSRTVTDASVLTLETDEPYHTLDGGSYYYQYHSAWYVWTAPGTGTMSFRSACTGTYRYPTAIAVYAGDEWDDLTRLSYSADLNSDYSTTLQLAVTQGTTYRIAVAVLYDLDGHAASLAFSWSGELVTASTETEGTPVAVPYAWLDAFYPGGTRTAADYETLALALAANGHDTVWQAYLLGLDPTNATSELTAQIRLVDGEPVVEWNVTNAALGSLGYQYRVLGATNLLEETWTPQTAGQRFFKVGVVPK